ncbi:unnamed protein product [Mycena citricolor]|uniref:Uncharacterized protein n=1 Tax=Mycena citricolor TaxID=2018698 RepID=A0AAD2JX57_9AGAR|nr:unnamed protein product [Mycena citricolor]
MSWGIGLLWRNHWLAWHYKQGWDLPGHNIGWGEIVAVELAVWTAIALSLTTTTLQLCLDNQGVIGALNAGKLHNAKENLVLQQITSLLLDRDIWLDIVWVALPDNLADALSRRKLGCIDSLIKIIPKLPVELHDSLYKVTDLII